MSEQNDIQILGEAMSAIGIFYTRDSLGRYQCLTIDGDDNGEIVDITFYFERESGKLDSIDVG